LAQIASSERSAWGKAPTEKPFIILAQPSGFDPSRAPTGRHTAWAYCHIPNGSEFDMTARIEAQIERFAPGFCDLILARSIRLPATMERENPNLVGGDVTGGANLLRQLIFRPTRRLYSTPIKGLFGFYAPGRRRSRNVWLSRGYAGSGNMRWMRAATTNFVSGEKRHTKPPFQIGRARGRESHGTEKTQSVY
jgi:hypothetical protein